MATFLPRRPRALLAVAAAALVLRAAAAKPWRPVPPCPAPLGVAEPAVAESMCSQPVAHAGDIVVREYRLPANMTLATARIDSPEFYDVLALGIQQLVQYFGGDNSASANILSARTTPVAVRDLRDNNETWIVSMMVSTAAFPDNSTIPTPFLPIQLESMGERSIAAVQFNTSSLPLAADFDKCLGQLFEGPLPKGFKFNMDSSWSPTFVVYTAEVSLFFTNECWAEVVKA